MVEMEQLQMVMEVLEIFQVVAVVVPEEEILDLILVEQELMVR